MSVRPLHVITSPKTVCVRSDRRVARADRRLQRREGARLELAAWAFSTRRVPLDAVRKLLPVSGAPMAGDLVLCAVDALGHHAGLQLPCGRRKLLFPGDEIVVAYGNRYASSQFEALVPETFGPCHLVAGGGIAAHAVHWHAKITKGPTHITPLAVLANAAGERVNLRQFSVPISTRVESEQPPTIAVVGTGMDSGKTQSAAYLVRGLMAAGLRVGYAKITGTGAGGDTWLLTDAGANPVFDFTDAGYATTYLASPREVESILTTLVACQTQAGVDAMVLEIADGVYQRETASLLESQTFARTVHGIVLAACDSMGASAGAHWLTRQPVPVLAISGIISAAPLQAREASDAIGLHVFNREQLSSPGIAMEILRRTQRAAVAAAPLLRSSAAAPEAASRARPERLPAHES